MGGKSGGKQTIGYRYLMTLHTGLCRGPIDELVEIQAGGLKAWPNKPAMVTQVVTFLEGFLELLAKGYTQPTGTIALATDPDPQLAGFYRKAADGGWIHLSSLNYTAGATESVMTSIDSPDLFGGERKEGGIQGTLQVCMGEPTQVTPPLLKAVFGDDLPAFRRQVTLVFDGMIAAMNPYPKEWRFRVRRALKGWFGDAPWYPAKAMIQLVGSDGGVIRAMNPAHIVYECLTNKEWGRGYDPALLDENSFLYAANTLCNELFGLCIAWNRQDDIDKFIQVVCDHIAAVVYPDRGTGLYTIRLIRNDYVPDDLPLFDLSSGLLDIIEDENTAATSDLAPNELVVKFVDPTDGAERSIRVQHQAGFQASGEVNSSTVTYSGIPTAKLAARVGLRDLGIKASAPKRFKVKLDRRGWRIAPGAPFRVSMPSRGIGELILRAGKVDDGTHTNGEITVTAVQDSFGLPTATWITPAESNWTPPSMEPAPASAYKALEGGYRDLLLEDVEPEDSAGYVCGVAARPTGYSTMGFDVWTQPEGGGVAYRMAGDWAPTGRLAADIGAYEDQLTLERMVDFNRGGLPLGLMIDNPDGIEICKITGLNAGTGEVSVLRGCADTIARPHAENTRIWVFDDYLAPDPNAYADGEEVVYRFVTRASGGTLDVGSSPFEVVTIQRRAERPYPPANVQANGDLIHTVTSVPLAEDIVFTWNHRDRLTQADQLIAHDDASVGPEAGVTYTFRIYDGDDLVRTADCISGNTWTYDAAMAAADGGLSEIRVELESSRGGLVSWQKYDVTIARS